MTRSASIAGTMRRSGPSPGRRGIAAAWRVFGMLLVACPGVAAAGEVASAEIEHLLRFVDSSGCGFVRNSAVHDAAAAQRHLRRKLEGAPMRMPSAEAFVRQVASRSSLSDEAYRVRCHGKEAAVEQWLLDELARHRRRVGR